MTDYYQILEVDKTATPDDIKKSYRRLASKNHPDKGGDTAKFQDIQSAYDTLSDPGKRAEYDNRGQNPHHININMGGHGPNIHDIFSQFGFNPFGGGHDPFEQFRQQHAPRRNKDLKINLNLDLKETLYEQNKTINVKATTGDIQTITVNIPRGITSGTNIKYPNLGDNMFGNLPRGDLYVAVNVNAHPDFQSGGLDLIRVLTIDCIDAIIGTTRAVEGLDGKVYEIVIPPGCQSNTKLKIPGEGMWAFRQDVKGNLYIQISISVPTNLSEEHKQLLKTIASQR